MSSTVSPDHPKQLLLFFIAQDVADPIRAKVRNFVTKLASQRRWVTGPPQFVDEQEEPLDISHGNTPGETVGGYLEIYSARPPFKLPRELDRRHLDEVTALVSALCEFSRQQQLTFEFELDGTFVGAITNGTPDRCLSNGLLGEWKRQLGGVRNLPPFNTPAP